MMSLLALVGAALAVDAHGPVPVISDGDPADPLMVWRPEAQRRGMLAMNTTFESAQDLLNVVTASADGLDGAALVDDVLAMNLGLSFAPSRRWAVAMTGPVYLSSLVEGVRSGASLGDLNLAVPIGLRVPGRGRGFGLSLVPFGALPTGDPAQYLGNGGLSGGALLASGLRLGGFEFDLNTGLEALPRDALANLAGGPQLLASVASTWQPRDNIAFHLEGLARTGLLDSAPVPVSRGRTLPCTHGRVADESACQQASDRSSTSDTPVELTFSVRSSVADRLSVTAGGSIGVSNGVGAPASRGYGGIGWTPNTRARPGQAKPAAIRPELQTRAEDLACDGSGQIAMAVELSGGSGYTVLSTIWKDEEGSEVGHDPELNDVPPGVYTVAVRYQNDETGKISTEERELAVGYEISWRDGEDPRLRSENLLPAGEEGWVELEPTGSAATFGLVRQWSPAAAASDAGWRAGAGAEAVAGGETVGSGLGARLRVSRELDGTKPVLVWTADGHEVARVDADLDQAMEIGASMKTPGSALGVTRASFGCPTDDDLEYGFGDAEAMDVGIRVEDDTLRLILRERGEGQEITLIFTDHDGIELATAQIQTEAGLNRMALALRNGDLEGDGAVLDWDGDARDAEEVELFGDGALVARQRLRTSAGVPVDLSVPRAE